MADPEVRSSVTLVAQLAGPEPEQETARATLAAMGAQAAPIFLAAFDDPDAKIRWKAALGLIDLGQVGLESVLRLLVEGAEDDHRLRCAHHVLHGLIPHGFARTVQPVLDAYLDKVPEYAIPQAAHAALNRLRAERS